MMKRFKIEWVNLPNTEPMWFDTQQEVDDWVAFIKSVPVSDGPVKLRITEFAATKVKTV